MKFEKIIESKINILIFFTVVSIVTFYKSIFFPYYFEDWGFLEQSINKSFFELISDISQSLFNSKAAISEVTLIRSVAPIYMSLLNKLFGLNPLIPHIIALLINALNAYLVFLISEIILKDRFGAFAVGFIYASAVIHSESMTWMTGSLEYYCMLFFLISLLLCIRERYLFSTLFFGLSIFVKEYSVGLPIIYFFYYLLFTQNTKNILEKAKTCLWKLKYHFIILILFLLHKIVFWPTDIQDTDAYKVQLFGIHIIENILAYLKYIFTEIFPTSLYFGRNLFELSFYVEIVIMLVILSIIVAIFYVKSKKTVINFDWKLIVFCVIFLGVTLGTVIFLPSHNYRYYLTVPSMSFLILIVYFIHKTFELFKLSKHKQNTWLVYYLVFHFVFSAINFNIIFAEKSSMASQMELSNKTQKFMMLNYPTLANNSVVVMKNSNMFVLDGSAAFRVMYQDRSINTFEFKYLVKKDNKYFISNPVLHWTDNFTGIRSNQEIELRKDKTVILEYKDKKYIDITGKYFM